MKNIPAGTRAVLGLFAVVWVAGMGAKVVTSEHPPPDWVWVRSEGSGTYPVVRGILVPDRVILTELEAGDRIVRVGEVDLRGRGQFGFLLATADVAWRTPGLGPIEFEVERDGRRLTVLEPRRDLRREELKAVFVAFVWGAAAILLLLRAPGSTLSRALFYGMGTHALMFVARSQGPPPLYLFSFALMVVGGTLTWPLLMRAFLLFSDKRDTLTGVNRWWPWITGLMGLAIAVEARGIWFDPASGRTALILGLMLYVLITIGVLGRSYAESGAVQRRRIKWVVFSSYVWSLISIGALILLYVAEGQPAWTPWLFSLSSVQFPLAVLIAILAFDLLDIDRLIGAAVAYNILIVVVIGAAMVFVPQLTRSMAEGLAVDPTLGQSGIALVFAGVIVVVQRRVQPQIDRLFFKERFAFESGMKMLHDQLAVARSPSELWSMVGEDLVTHLRPATCTIFTSAGNAFVPEFTAGDAVPPLVRADTDLVAWVADLDAAAEVDRRIKRDVGAFGRALLANLEAEVVFPVHREGQLEAFVCLGEKRSGDIFTRTDLTLLTSLAKSLSVHLLRFDEAELLERSREIQAKMRRYVPGAVAKEIDSGRDLETGEREVAVLFVDIRGYTAFSDGRRASDIFSTVNRYTETVSAIVSENGGAVVEFNGDGMMAVFGAPRPLPEKERAAMKAARSLVHAVPLLGVESGDESLSVGVGVATGPAFVGNIESTDRVIWTAIGSTINLAARLQALTRDLDASVLIDETTRSRIGPDGGDLVMHPEIAIRGKSKPRTLFALPGEESGAVN